MGTRNRLPGRAPTKPPAFYCDLLEPVLTGDTNYWRQSLRFSVVGSKSLRNGLISNPPRRL
jgi:hypothetical protein